ncbi:NAD(P)H-binding protein [Actinoplanes sp. RD1]|uniref:NAD(P)H-binding protein n=1 Tax=Actinoplanes sp. RD1 TaxID=3064538 RepID=UPI002740943D|nr:NAD(P)H-binding protein [Actinoplanes sp. RD1]
MIVVTAPTSAIGRQVVEHLLSTGTPLRVVARDPARLAPGVAAQAEVVRGSHSDPAVVADAFAGADAVFWLVPPDPRATSLEAAFSGFARAAIEAFKAAGRVVGISALGRGTAVAGHAGYVTASLAMDDLIAATGVPYRALTMPSFMDNLLRQAGLIKSQGIFTALYDPERPLPLVATRDIAAVAARLLRDDTWTGYEEVPVLGPELLSQHDLAAVMSDVLGRPVRYQRTTPEATLQLALGQGVSEAMAHGRVDMLVAKNNGLDDTHPGTPLGSTTFRQWCLDVLKPAVEA